MEHHHQHTPTASRQRTAHNLPIQPSPLRPPAATQSLMVTPRQMTPKTSPPAPSAQMTLTLPALDEEESESLDSSESEDDQDLMDF